MFHLNLLKVVQNGIFCIHKFKLHVTPYTQHYTLQDSYLKRIWDTQTLSL